MELRHRDCLDSSDLLEDDSPDSRDWRQRRQCTSCGELVQLVEPGQRTDKVIWVDRDVWRVLHRARLEHASSPLGTPNMVLRQALGIDPIEDFARPRGLPIRVDIYICAPCTDAMLEMVNPYGQSDQELAAYALMYGASAEEHTCLGNGCACADHPSVEDCDHDRMEYVEGEGYQCPDCGLSNESEP